MAPQVQRPSHQGSGLGWGHRLLLSGGRYLLGLLKEHLVWHHFGRPELGRYHLGVYLMPVFSLDVSPHGVVAGE